jgi:CO/xanthine dehydrogenase FAD-binding subunit
MTLFPICAALDAQAELRTESASRWVPVSRLWNDKAFSLEPFEILTRIRFPLDSWDVEIARNVGNPQYPDDSSFMYVFLARANRGILGDFRLLFSGLQFFRRRDIEGSLIGKRLPLSAVDRSDILQMYREALALDALFLPTLRQAQCLRLLTNDLELLS